MRLWLSLSLLLVTGCTTVAPKNMHSVAGLAPGTTVPNRQQLASQNFSTLESRYNEESKLWKTGGTPWLGIALSGGGSRSAAFNLGILKGLSDIKILENTDYISSVSGGGYIASWYFLQRYYPECNDFGCLASWPVKDSDLFNWNGKHQIFLGANGELVGTTSNNYRRRIEYGNYFLTVLASTPVNVFLNGIFGLHANVSPMRYIYQNGIEREFHTVPSGDDAEPLNSHVVPGLGVKREATFQELKNFINQKYEKNERIPIPIINTTAHIKDQDGFLDDQRLKYRVFEFTPFHYGSDYYGYSSGLPPVTVNTAYTISGAAFDSKKLNSKWGRIFLSAINADLGYYINNYNIEKPIDRILSKLLPFPFYMFSGRWQNDLNGTDIYLADGGHAENLGAYSLVRRLTRNIIISDAEADPDYTFGAYTDLKNAVEAEFNVKFSVPEIDQRLAALQACKHKDKRECAPLPKAVMMGTIEAFPFSDKGKVEDIVIKVIYIKPVVDVKVIETSGYSAIIREYYRAHENDKTNHVSKFGPFPQEATSDQTYAPTQVAAYRELGWKIVEENKEVFRTFLPISSITAGISQ